MTADTTTLSTLGEDPDDESQDVCPYLVVAACGTDGASAGERFLLRNLDEVVIARGSKGFSRCDRTLRVSRPDPRISTDHMRLSRVGEGHWRFEDLGSKNGTALNGRKCREHLLRPGDQLGAGHLLFVYLRREASRDTPEHLAAPAGIADPMFTFCPRLGDEFAGLDPIARSERTVLVLGDTGTGKELIARALHERSMRTGAFVAVNCGALPDALIESELFGHKRGAFSGAVADSIGLIRSAHRGTLFLDEIAELPPSSQVALLRVLQERVVTPVGDTRVVPIDIRVVAATHQDLGAAMDRGAFRRDLYARLTNYSIELPLLRDRIEDIGLLTASIAVRHGASGARLSPSALRALFAYDWPFNIRELDNALSAAFTRAKDNLVTFELLPAEVRGVGRRELDERATLVELLTMHKGNVLAVATAWGKDRSWVRRRIQRYGLDPASYR
jgi:DNA-binding NtrC family response regulator